MQRLKISTKEEYLAMKVAGYEPLGDISVDIDMHIRVALIKEKFPKASGANDVKFYKWAFEVKGDICEETGIWLRSYQSCFVSHILSKGAYTEMRYDLRNVNILCLLSHSLWEFGTIQEKQTMKIWEPNQATIFILKKDYNDLRNNRF